MTFPSKAATLTSLLWVSANQPCLCFCSHPTPKYLYNNNSPRNLSEIDPPQFPVRGRYSKTKGDCSAAIIDAIFPSLLFLFNCYLFSLLFNSFLLALWPKSQNLKGSGNLRKKMSPQSDPLTTLPLSYPGKTNMILGDNSHKRLISGWQHQVSEVPLGHYPKTISAVN